MDKEPKQQVPDLDKLKMLFGFLLIFLLIVLGLTLALAKVEEDTSHGLMPLITTISTLAGAFGNWAFGQSRSKGNEKKELEGGPE